MSYNIKLGHNLSQHFSVVLFSETSDAKEFPSERTGYLRRFKLLPFKVLLYVSLATHRLPSRFKGLFFNRVMESLHTICRTGVRADTLVMFGMPHGLS
jgi:hypothetical protein